ncbi:MAG TPA: hypothetical protein DEO85_03155 [Maritimibacter sp.]|nr:hypothetical protein [Maritimibacter sp.]
MNAHNIRTMQDLLNKLDKLGYSQSVVNQVRPRIKECVRIYNRPLSDIPADYDAFVERWGKGRISALAEGFRSHEHFIEFRKRIRGALSKLHLETTAPQELLPEWPPVLDVIRENSGPKKTLGPHRLTSATFLANSASAQGARPCDLTPGAITRLAAMHKGNDRRTFKLGISGINQLFDHPKLLQPVAHLLPAPLSQPANPNARASTRRRHGPNSDAGFWDEFDAFVAAKRGFDSLGRPIPAEESEFKQNSAETYENAVNSAMGVLERAGVLTAGDTLTLRELCSYETISMVADTWQVRMLDGEVSKETATLHQTVERLSHIATFSKFLGKKKRKKLQKLRDRVRKKAKRRSKMSAPREAWIKAFSRSSPQQLAVHTMPEQLIRKAQKILDDWDGLKRNKKAKTRMRALHLGIAAVQAAILFRGSSVRASNLRQLPFRGDDAQLILDLHTADVRISIPEHLTKNGVEIEADCDEDAWSVIEWYLKEIRPRLINDHPYGHNLTDSDYLFPSKNFDRAMEETTFAEHYRIGVEAVGLKMTLHQARHITAYFILSEDPNAMALAAAVLGDEVSTVEAFYAWMDGVKAVVEGRRLLRDARQNSRKRKVGRLKRGAA